MRRLGGVAGNAQLTAIVAAVLLVGLAVEGVTLLQIDALLTVHAFVGILLLPLVLLKLASTSWRMLRYYLGSAEYVRHGPPRAVLRTLVAPAIVLSTVVLFATGIGLLALDRSYGTLLTLHKAAFVVWFGATGVHALAHLRKLPRLLRRRLPGLAPRVALVAAVVGVGAFAAVATLPSVDHLQDQVTAQIGVDAG